MCVFNLSYPCFRRAPPAMESLSRQTSPRELAVKTKQDRGQIMRRVNQKHCNALNLEAIWERQKQIQADNRLSNNKIRMYAIILARTALGWR